MIMEALELALKACKLSDRPNYSHIAREFDVQPETLRRRHKGIQGSREQAHFQTHNLLSQQQEKDLVSYINKLTVRGCPPTPAMVRNFAYDICKKWPGKNWVSKFRKRHEEVLLSKYLKGADLARKQADNYEYYKDYFDLVSYFKRAPFGGEIYVYITY